MVMCKPAEQPYVLRSTGAGQEGGHISKVGPTWDLSLLSSFGVSPSAAVLPNAGMPDGKLRPGKAEDAGAAAESAAACVLRMEPELVDGAKPYAPLPGVMPLRNPSNPAQGSQRYWERPATDDAMTYQDENFHESTSQPQIHDQEGLPHRVAIHAERPTDPCSLPCNCASACVTC